MTDAPAEALLAKVRVTLVPVVAVDGPVTVSVGGTSLAVRVKLPVLVRWNMSPE